jgi:large repetitive protein
METQSNVKLFGNLSRSVTRFLVTAFCLFGAVAATAGPLKINVIGVAPNGTQTPITTNYRWTVEEDATKLSVPGRPATTANYSFSFHTSYMPVLAAGRVGTMKAGVTADPDVARLYAETPPDVCPSANKTCLESGKDGTGQPLKRYYVSVAAEGFQMGGAPVVFTSSGATANVYVNQYPLPTSQVSVFAFNDNNPINGSPDLPQETGLAGFTVQLYEAGGTYGQSGGEVTQDGFGNPLGTTYNDDGSVKKKGAGIVLTGPDGTAVIKNLFPAKYTVVISPPVNTDWHQTSTIEGTRGSDAWVKNNEPSFFQEFGPPGHHVFIGFTRSGCVQGAATGAGNTGRCNGLSGPTSNKVTGRIVNVHNSRTPNYAFEKGAPVPECWVGLNETGGGTRALYAIPCNKDSTFTIPNVPSGTYELVVWDDPLDMIIGTQTITVAGDLPMGDVPVFSWFGRYQGRVFQDIDGTGLPFFAEPFNKPYIKVDPVTGIETTDTKSYAAGDLKPAFGEGIANNIRFRDGSIYQSATTKADGTFAFTELFPFFNWMIAEIDYARYKATGATMVPDAGGVIDPAENARKLWNAKTGSFGSSDPAFAYNPWIRLNPQLQETCDAAAVAANLDADGKIIDATACFKVGEKYYRTEQGVVLLEGMQTFLGQTNHIEWGKQPYAGEVNGPKNENGGIAGIVHYAITRAEDDPRYATAENWEPGIPRVQIGLFLDCDGDGKIDKPANDGTGQCAAGGLSKTDGYVADLPDVDNYPFCWRDPESCGLPKGSAGVMGPEDIKRSAAGGTAFSYGDVFSWGGPNTGAGASGQLHVGLGKTDSWDDSTPNGCIKPGAGAVGNGSIQFNADLDCFDGLYNFNQLRPSVFDGGYAFGRVAGQAELPVFIGKSGKGTYIVEAKAPPGYLHQGNGDKNVTFGDQLQASTAALPFECVGMELDVPAKLTLFADGTPDTDNPNYANGAKWRKCDMKAVALMPGTNPAPDFHMFTEAPVAGHGVGFILDDTATEFNRFSPSFGEKYAPPHLPVSVQDWTGREITRVYSDQFGSYNFLVPSSFTINPPFPSGVMPSMMVSCMNHPGPIVDERPFKADGVTPNPTFGQKIIDPFFNRKYTQFCYTLQYLPGKTTYLDTPVLPIAAFASVEKNPLDCDCQDKTPAIYSANNQSTANYGPWVPATGGTLNIVSAGSAYEVPNPAYDPTVPGSPKNITRDYSFGSGGTVKLGGVTLTPTSWTPDLMVLPVPSTMPVGAHQLTITRADSGKESVVGITVHVGGTTPITVVPGASIQAVIDAPTTPAGALITIPPGTYNEYLILDKRVRLQGWGANSVTINSSKASAGGLAAWRTLLNKKVDVRCSLANGTTAGPAPNFVTYPQTGCPANTPIDVNTGGPTLVAGPNRTFDPLLGQTLGINKSNNEPILFGAEEGAGILALGKASILGNSCAGTNLSYRIDGLSLTGSDSGGGILASGYNCDLQITNNRVMSNYGTYGGGVRVGHTSLVGNIPVAGTARTVEAYSPGFNNNVVIDHNWITQNGASEIASGDGGGGGVTLGTGTNNYVVSNNYVCGNFSMSDGGGVSHVGLSGGANIISNNKIILNQTFNQSADPTGGGLYIGGQVALGAGASDGTGKVTVDRNQIQYNHAGAGAGGGVSIARTNDAVLLTNNMIVNNATAYAGGGVAVADVSANTRLVNNTVADNTSTATNRQSFPPGPKEASSAQIAGIAKLSGTEPTMLNNIVWGNKSFTWSIDRTGVLETTKLTAVPGFWEMGKVGDASHTSLPSTNSILSAGSDVSTNCTACLAATADQIAFVRPINFTPVVDPDQIGVLPETTIMQTALTFDEGGNFINVIFSPLTLWDIIPGDLYGTLRAEYHIKGAAGAGTVDSIALNAGVAPTATNFVPVTDFDGQNRTGGIDVGADEVVQPAPFMSVNPTSLNFGVTMVNGSKTLTVTVSNAGNANLVLAAPSISGGNATARYSVANVDCPTVAPGLSPGVSCTLNVTYMPTAVTLGAQTATLNVNSANNLPLSIVVPLTGVAFVPTYSIAPGPLGDTNFGNQLVGTSSAPRQFTLTNAGSSVGNLQLNGQPTLTGTNANQFQAAYRAGDTCTATTSLAPGASCTFSVVFAPTSAGTKGTVLLPGGRVGVAVVSGVNTGVLGSPVRGVAGTTTARTVAPTGTTLTFPNTARGSVSAAQTVTVTNTGFLPVAVTSIGVTGANAANWQQTNTCGTSIAVNANCTISVRFTPVTGGAAGARNATLSIVDAVGTTSKTVNGNAL